VSLVSLQSRPWKWWLTVALTFLVAFPLLGFLVTYWVLFARDANAPGGEALGFTVLGLMALGAVVTGLRAAWMRLRRGVIDEGGIRVAGLAASRYVPFSAIRDVSLREGALGTTVVDVLTDDGSAETFTLPANAHHALDTVLATATTQPPPRGHHELERLRDPLAQWCRRLDRQLSPLRDGAYRSPGLDAATLDALLRDTSAPAELRAAAGYMRAASASPDELSGLRAMLDAGTPPIVVLMTTLGARDADLGGRALLASALRYLGPVDRQQARALLEAAKRGTDRLRIADPSAPPASGHAAESAHDPAEAEVQAELEAAANITPSSSRSIRR
jgi:hypothetical protein